MGKDIITVLETSWNRRGNREDVFDAEVRIDTGRLTSEVMLGITGLVGDLSEMIADGAGAPVSCSGTDEPFFTAPDSSNARIVSHGLEHLTAIVSLGALAADEEKKPRVSFEGKSYRCGENHRISLALMSPTGLPAGEDGSSLFAGAFNLAVSTINIFGNSAEDL